MSKTFLLIDHTITGLGGHHFEYAKRILEAAQAEGLKPQLATHENADLRDCPWPSHPVYRQDFWSTNAGSPGRAARVKSVFDRLRAKAAFSDLTAVWILRGEFDILRWYIRSWRIRHKLLLAALSPFLFTAFYVLKVFVSALALLFLLLPFRGNPLDIAKAAGRLLRALVFPLIVAFKLTMLIARPREKKERRSEFGGLSASLVKKLGLGSDDHVFIPTLGPVELAALARDWPRDLPVPHMHLLFRRNLFRGRPSGYGAQGFRREAMERALEVFKASPLVAKTKFYTDTQELTAQYDLLGGPSFRTLGIPVDDRYKPTLKYSPPACPRRFVYAGDARTEKGYALLPTLVRGFDGKPGHLVAQSNYNVPHGEPKVVIARNEIEAMHSAAVELLRRPLTSDEYRELVLSGDVSLILYDAEAYFARSSGVFVESLTAGIPVLVSAGSWMSLQLAGLHRAHHEKLLAEGALISRSEITPTGEKMYIPEGATMAIIEATGPFIHGSFRRLEAEFFDSLGRRVSAATEIFGGPAENSSMTALRLPSGAVQGRFHLRDLEDGTSEGPQAEMRFISQGEPRPCFALGVPVADEKNLQRAAHEITEHWTAYKADALAFVPAWSSRHSPRRLVRDLFGGHAQ